jgi:crotonobetainyl-CoA:carnitine CoA-transferase CaiB-like acyl-CoA transferase
VAMSASIQSMAKRVFEVIGRPEMIEDERFRTNSGRVRNRVLVDEAVGSWFALLTREEALARMRAGGVTVGPVYDIDDAVEDPHFRDRNILVEVEDPDLGSIPMHNIVPRLSATPGVWRRAAPKLGEHTDAILAEAGYDAEAIAAMRRGGAAA